MAVAGPGLNRLVVVLRDVTVPLHVPVLLSIYSRELVGPAAMHACAHQQPAVQVQRNVLHAFLYDHPEAIPLASRRFLRHDGLDAAGGHHL